jgi:nucleoid DNA-binding protein
MTTTQKTITAKISEKTGRSHYKSQKALTSVLDCIKQALADGKEVDLERLGKLKTITRKPTRRINKNLNRIVTIENVYKKYPKTVRLVGGKDLSEDPQPTIIHKVVEAKVEIPARRTVKVVIAFPVWRSRKTR